VRSKVKDHAIWSRRLQYIILLCVIFFCLFPIIWLFMASLKTNQEFLNSPWKLPTELHWSNYARAWSVGRIQKYFLNSVIVVGSSVIIILIICLPAAFALIRLRFKLQKVLLSIVLFGLMIPVHSIAVPLFQTMNGLKLRGTLLTMILPYIAFGVPITILILSGRLRTISRELEEAAVIDGCGIFGLFGRIIIPLLLAETITIVISNFIWMWNELFLAVIFTSSDKLRTLPFGLYNFVSQYETDWVTLISAILISFLPLFLLYLVLQKYIIGGMTAGSIKG
jgi:raffinose/stachyose/melibiose transport system permease protein